MARWKTYLRVDGFVIKYNRYWTEDEVIANLAFMVRALFKKKRPGQGYVTKVRYILKTPLMKKSERPDIVVFKVRNHGLNKAKVYIPVLVIEVQKGENGVLETRGKRMADCLGGVPYLYCRGREDAKDTPSLILEAIDQYLGKIDEEKAFQLTDGDLQQELSLRPKGALGTEDEYSDEDLEEEGENQPEE